MRILILTIMIGLGFSCASVGEAREKKIEITKKMEGEKLEGSFNPRVIQEKYVLKLKNRQKGKQQCVDLQCRRFLADPKKPVFIDCASADNTYYESISTIQYANYEAPVVMNPNDSQKPVTPVAVVTNGLYGIKEGPNDPVINYAIQQARNKSDLFLLNEDFTNGYAIFDPYYQVSTDVIDKGGSVTVKACSTVSARAVELIAIDASDTGDEVAPVKKGKK
ncbi:MAG TPA: hypothetical protein PLX69_18020 [Leptospiraceae bacterium]|nr:hypothetical protein [Leptospiraceae bacterium]HRG76462.1 hypothetical protein [Leptospiraceae bacterium]